MTPWLARPAPLSHPGEGSRAEKPDLGSPLAAISHPRPEPGPHLEAAAAPSADGRAPPVHHDHVLGRCARRAAPAPRGLQRRLRARVRPAVQVAQHHLQSPHRAVRPHRPLHPARYQGPEPRDSGQRNRDTGPLPSKPKHRPLPTARRDGHALSPQSPAQSRRSQSEGESA